MTRWRLRSMRVRALLVSVAVASLPLAFVAAARPVEAGLTARMQALHQPTNLRAFLGGRLWVTRFAGEVLRSGQRAEVVGDASYWDALRRHADTVVIDSPAADRSDTSILLAPFVDSTVLVVASNSTK